MRLSQLSMSNFRKFADLSIDFDEHITVLVGTNGAGKTAVLDAAAVALSAFLTKFPDVSGAALHRSDARRVRYKSAPGIYDHQELFPVTIQARGSVLRNDEFDAEAHLGGLVPTFPKPISWGRSLRQSKGKMTVADARPMIDVSDACQQAVREGEQLLLLPMLGYYGTDRLWPRDRAQWRTHSDEYLQAGNRFGGYDGCLNSSVSYKQMASWFKKMTVEEHRQQKLIPSFQAVRRTVAHCLELLTGNAEARIDYADGGLLVSYTTSDGLSVADEPFESLSDGYRVMVGMVADIARRMATLNPALGDRAVLETPGVVLIDEVDLHLHPLWQRQVVETLLALFPQVQFIVTTHAPMVISSVHRNQVRQLSCDTVTGQARAVTPSYETYGQSASDTLDTVQEADSLPLPGPTSGGCFRGRIRCG